jgi:cell division protein FtsB
MRKKHVVNRKHRSTSGYIVVLVAALFVLGAAISGRSFLRIYRLSKTVREERIQKDDIARKKALLDMEVFKLANDSLYIEDIARREYGMIRRGEEAYTISLPDTAKEKKEHDIGK